MILSLRSLCAAFLLWTSCSVIAENPKGQNSVTEYVSLVRKLDGKLLNYRTPFKSNSDYSVLESTGSPSVRSPEEWLIQIGPSSWQAKSSPDGLLKVVKINKNLDRTKRLVIGKVNFESNDDRKQILDGLVEIKPGGKFEYTKQIIKALKNAKVWTELGGYKTFKSMYKETEVPIGSAQHSFDDLDTL
ncbi:hypothetical protein DFH05DRAFT_1523568 [Lentinula detonsa]|uniref:Uncharacterized protein n=1 Tax=Lentinula detonsa TaxID=2804962 RepID=A0A9W8P1R8_9AGAR|nr:hypothetical protein DFH05DRAFT_1523568 [Lentinula detonsa]